MSSSTPAAGAISALARTSATWSARLARLDHENRYTLIARPQDAAEISGLGSNFRPPPTPARIRTSLHNFTFPLFPAPFHADLYHIPLNSVACWMPQPYVLTIHDMSTLLFPYAQRFARNPA